ncbi:MAG TPA: protein kinase [Ktedonobacterales bacterium]
MQAPRLGNYELIRRLGEGGMAQVYLARDVRLVREVAVKVLDKQLAKSEGFRLRFEREAQLAAGLDHPHIVPLYDFGENSGMLYLVMPYLSGGSLQQMLKRTPLPVNDVVSYGTQMTDALEFAHERGVVHRDVKPANMLLHSDGRLMLADFGLAKIFDGSPRSHRNGRPDAGTPEYMAPEQIRGRSEPRSDLYGLGVVLYLLLTGRLPFSAQTSEAVMDGHLYAQPASLRSLNPRITPAIEAAVLRALAKRPEDRFASASEMGAALMQALVAGDAEPLPFVSGPSGAAAFSQPSQLPAISGLPQTQDPYSPVRAYGSGGRGASGGTSATSLLPSLDVPEANARLSDSSMGPRSSLPTGVPHASQHAPAPPTGSRPGSLPAAVPGAAIGSVMPARAAQSPSFAPQYGSEYIVGSEYAVGSPASAAPAYASPPVVEPLPLGVADALREQLPTRPLGGSAFPGQTALVEPPAAHAPVAPLTRVKSPLDAVDPAPRGHRPIFWVVIALLLIIMLAALGTLIFWFVMG